MKVGPAGATTAEEESRKKINGTKKEKELKEEKKKRRGMNIQASTPEQTLVDLWNVLY